MDNENAQQEKNNKIDICENTYMNKEMCIQANKIDMSGHAL
jgi:hypothetical protein